MSEELHLLRALPATPPVTRDHSPLKYPRTEHSTSQCASRQFLNLHQKLGHSRSSGQCVLDGSSLAIHDVVAVAKHGASALLSADPRVRSRIDRSVETLDEHLQAGNLVYGVNTGFGGSADTRTNHLSGLQMALIQHQQSGILTSQDTGRLLDSSTSHSNSSSGRTDAQFDVQSMPTAWVRASMLVRCNSVIRGHSAVRSVIIETILALIREHITPIVPLRGSVSASGDLSPLSYIAGAIEGNPDIFVRCGRESQTVMTAQQALKKHNIEPVILGAKEGLGLLNGTAFSAATASLAVFQAQEIALMAQVLTAMGVEALSGTAESFHPKIAEMRPHPGQIESAANILSFLNGSKLASGLTVEKDIQAHELCQDRYALRTSSQWIGPQLEDLCHAHDQLVTELNSTTDNPLIDVENNRILHGGNFQAAVVTSTMDRTRLALEKFGRMLFAQATELINPATNKGLPPNLCSDEPSLSFTCKGADINMAAYASELGFLANPVGNHVMSAEMHNQSINSLALVSSRYTFQALDTIRMLCATHLFVLCQALDLRVLQLEFAHALKPQVEALVASSFPPPSPPTLTSTIWHTLLTTWSQNSTLDLPQRALRSADSTIPTLITSLSSSPSRPSFESITLFTTALTTLMTQTYTTARQTLYKTHLSTTPEYLGTASRALYTFVRSPSPAGLGIPFHRGLEEYPLHPTGRGSRIVGSDISVVYEALRDGRVADVMAPLLAGRFEGVDR